MLTKQFQIWFTIGAVLMLIGAIVMFFDPTLKLTLGIMLAAFSCCTYGFLYACENERNYRKRNFYDYTTYIVIATVFLFACMVLVL